MQASLEAGISIGDVEKVGDSIVDRLGRREDPRPFYLTRVDAKVGDGVNPVTLSFYSPPTGSIWQVRSITTFGTDDHTVVASVVCALYAGDRLNLSLASLKVVGLTIPSTTFIPDTAIWCHPTEELVIITSGVIASGQNIGANIVVEEWKEKDVSRNSGR